MSLPSGYTRYEYIQSSGTQYVDTGFIPNQDTRVVFDFEPVSVDGTHLFGCRSASSASDYFLTICTGGYFRDDYATEKTSTGVAPSERITIDKNKNVTTIGEDAFEHTYASFAGSYSISLFGSNTGGTVSYYTSVKLYSCQIYDNGVLVRAFIPCCDEGGNVGLWDLVSETFYGNSGSGVFTAGSEIGYARVEYIESSGTQYIDTGFTPNQDTRFVCDVKWVATTNSNYLFGVRTSSLVNAFSVNSYGGNYQSQYNTEASVITSSTDSRFVLDKNKNTTTMNGMIVSHTYASFQCTGSAFLFAMNNGGTVHAYSTVTLYSCQIYDNDTLVRDFVPVVRQDGTAGLLDQLTGTFYGNAGTGVFTAGPEVEQEPEEPEVPSEVPGGLIVLGTTQHAALVSWLAASQAQTYRLYRDGVLVYEGTGVSYTDTGLGQGMVYTYTVTGDNGTGESEAVSAAAGTKNAMWLITDRTAADVAEGTDKGHYNCLDLIRVNEAMDYVAGLLRICGYTVDITTKADWQLTDVPTAEELDLYLQNIQTLRGKMELAAGTPEVAETMEGLTWETANDLEQILLNAEDAVFHIYAGFKRSAQMDAWCGDMIIPTANSDLGRTWEELDAMETTWSNWQEATWYLLLYGNLEAEGEVS